MLKYLRWNVQKKGGICEVFAAIGFFGDRNNFSKRLADIDQRWASWQFEYRKVFSIHWVDFERLMAASGIHSSQLQHWKRRACVSENL